MDKITAHKNFLGLVESLQALAASYVVQKEAFPPFVCTADELALNFDDRFYFLDKDKHFQLVNSEQIILLKEMDIELTKMSKNKSLWSDDALSDSEEWDKIRSLAKQILHSLGIEEQKPNLGWITYVKIDNKE